MKPKTDVADPLLRFEAEHDEALAALLRLETAASALRAGEAPGVHLDTMTEVLGSLTGAVRKHNENEEKALFPFIGDVSPVNLFVAEHNELRSLEQQLGEALQAPDAADRVPPIALSIVDLLRSHIDRENHVLFPIAREALGIDGLAKVAQRLNE